MESKNQLIISSLLFLYIQDAHVHLIISMLLMHSRCPWPSCKFWVFPFRRHFT